MRLIRLSGARAPFSCRPKGEAKPERYARQYLLDAVKRGSTGMSAGCRRGGGPGSLVLHVPLLGLRVALLALRVE